MDEMRSWTVGVRMRLVVGVLLKGTIACRSVNKYSGMKGRSFDRT